MAEVNYFNVYVTDVVETVKCNENTNRYSLVFWGLKDRELAIKMEAHIKTCTFTETPPLDTLPKKLFCVNVHNSWLRAVVGENSSFEETFLRCFCIDCGLTVMAPPSCIREIPSAQTFIQSCHPLATKFTLGDVVIEKGVLEPTIQYFQKYLCNRNVTALSLSGDLVRIYLSDVLVAKKIVENFIGCPLATYPDALKRFVPNHRQISVPSTAMPLPMAKNSSSGLSAMSVSRKMLNVSYHKKTDSGKFYTASCLETNVVHKILVTYVQNGPQQFVIQRKNSDAVEKLNHLSKKLATLNSKTLVNVDRGTPCIAISSRDKLFHRALVTLVDDVRYAEVYFVDYGYFELVDKQSLFEIPSEFGAIKLFAFRVTLEDAASLMKLEHGSEKFTQLVWSETFSCQVSGETVPQSVILTDNTGRTVKDLVLASLTNPRPAVKISQFLKITAPTAANFMVIFVF